VSDDEPLVLPAGDWTLMPRPRVAPAVRSSLGPVARGLLWLTRRRTGERGDFTVLLTLARLGKLFPAHAIFLSQLLGKTRLTAVEKEIVVLRVAWRLGCAYEYTHHHRMATELGVAADQITAATTDNLDAFTPRLAALLAAADELVHQHKLSDGGWRALREYRTDEEALELCMFVGHYVMIAMIINTAGVQPEPRFAVRDCRA
jgi:4-carboxymuconolactone decarboxylase